MNNKKSRSSLKKVSTQCDEEANPARCYKRRISFSEKKFIREFDAAEKPRDYDHSYEISDHTNGSDSSGQSHATVAASLLQSTARITVANTDMDKENAQTSIVSDLWTSNNDEQSRNDFTLKLQTSINLTLLPDELSRNRRRIESPASLELKSGDSLSLCEMERVKLRENSIYNIPVFDKTMDLVPQKLIIAENAAKHVDKENVYKPITISKDISCVAPKDKEMNQNTVVFQNHDVSCGFIDIEPAEVATPNQENVSLDMVEGDYMNYLADDSTLSSPLIPLDVISENGISKKLNFRELNDALNSGRIQLFPNGPRTPATDRTAKQKRFWHGFEQQPMEEDIPMKDVIKPRGTLNFDDSMMVSPAFQKPEPKLKATTKQPNEFVKEKSSRDPKRNYRFSQADELMLDNTNFLVHAKMGDETQSRNSSKCSSSRRETTYDNTAMELNDLEKHEAAVAAALETAKNKESMNHIEAMEEDDFLIPFKKATDTQDIDVIEDDGVEFLPAQQQNRPRQTMHMFEPIEDISFGWQEEIQPEPAVAPKENKKILQSQTLHVAEPIDEISFNSKSTFVRKEPQYKKQRPTMHMAEPIKEDIVVPQISQKAAPAEKNNFSARSETQYQKQRPTMHMAEPIKEDIVVPQISQKAAPTEKNDFRARRETLHMTEIIDEENLEPRQRISIKPVDFTVKNQQSKRRQTLLNVESMEEDSFCAKSNVLSDTAEIIDAEIIEEVRKSSSKPRQIMQEDKVLNNDKTGVVFLPAQQQNRPRQTMHMFEPIEDISFGWQDEIQPEPEVAPKETKKILQTFHLAEPAEEQIFCGTKRRTLRKEKAIQEDGNCMPKQTEDNEKTNVQESTQRSIWMKNTLGLSMEMELLSQSSTEDAEKAGDECSSESAEWLAQMRDKDRQTIANSMPLKLEYSVPTIKKITNPVEEDKKNVLVPKYNRINMESPKPSKKQRSLSENYFPVTPGRSMIEYEDLEQKCTSDSSAPKFASAQSQNQCVDMELDIDRSNYGTPVAASRKTVSSNVKRLPIDLTPNFPQSKKRNTQSRRIEIDNTSQIKLDTPPIQNVEQSTRSRIPVLFGQSNTIQCSPSHQQEHLDSSIQIVRAQVMPQTRSHFETEINCIMKNQQKQNAAVYEDNPITISDVSDHFSAQRELAKRLCEQPKNATTDSRDSNEHHLKNYATVHKDFMNLSGDTVIFAAAELPDGETDDCLIDKTRLSLVSTLLDEEDNDDHNEDACLEQVNPPAIAGAVDACKKCKHCRLSVDVGRNTSADSFELPDWRDLDLALERLERMRQRPRVEDVHRYFELKKLERYSNCSDETASNSLNESTSSINNKDRLNLPQMLEIFNNKWNDYKKSRPTPMQVETFVKRLKSIMCDQLPNWIFDYQLQCNRNYMFAHRKITTFRLVVSYEPLDQRETEIRVNYIKSDTSTIIPKDQWSVYEHLMDFQLRLNLPLNLENLLDDYSVEAFVKFLQHIDEICIKVLNVCNNMHMVLHTAQARLIRETNRNVARKIVRRFIKNEDEAYMRVEKTLFRIEIGNVDEISFKNILEPPLYQFDENIQFLPRGISFLEAFMQTPEQYLKRNVEQIN